MKHCSFDSVGRGQRATGSGAGNRGRRLWFALTMLGLMMAVSCGRPQPTNVLATVGDRRITTEDLHREVERRQQARQRLPDKETLLRQMVEQEVMLTRARALGLDQDAQTQREIAFLLISKLRDRELAPRVQSVKVSEEEVETLYRTDLAKYTRSAKVRLAGLLLKGDPGSSEAKRAELRARLEDARRKIMENPSAGGRGPAATGFGALALDYSDDPATRYRGGDLGWLDPGNLALRWPGPVLEAGYQLAKGQVSEVLEAGSDFYLIMKSDDRPAAVTPFAEVQATLRQSLLAQKRRQLEAAFEQEVFGLVPVTFNEPALAAVTLPEPRVAMAQTDTFEPPALMGGNDSTNGN